jgi:uncharacterized membrane protein (DUF2068 family)
MSARGTQPLTWIIGFKVLKGACAVLIGCLLLATRKMIPAEDLLGLIAHWLHVPLTSHFLQRALFVAASLTPRREAMVAFTSFAYGGLFGIEAVGLAMRAKWARWLTIIATTSLIPVEVYELLVRFTFVRLTALLVNVAVVWYLVQRKDEFEG